jgi:hypothetical protein
MEVLVTFIELKTQKTKRTTTYPELVKSMTHIIVEIIEYLPTSVDLKTSSQKVEWYYVCNIV